jgi:hypothetical protein
MRCIFACCAISMSDKAMAKLSSLFAPPERMPLERASIYLPCLRPALDHGQFSGRRDAGSAATHRPMRFDIRAIRTRAPFQLP